MRFWRYLTGNSGGPAGREQEDLEKALSVSGRKLRDSVSIAAHRVARVEAGLAPRLAAIRRAEGEWVVRGVESLRRDLTPICGASGADRALRLAALRCSGAGVADLTEAHWPGFLGHLRSIVAGLCGASPMRAVLGAGAALENVA